MATSSLVFFHVVAQSLHMSYPFHPFTCVRMAQEIVLADLWCVVAVHLFLQVISRIAKRSLVSFVSPFSFFLL